MPAIVSLYTGVGGLDFGFEAAGFETRAALELDDACCDTLERNRDWPVLRGDIHEVKSNDILKTAGLDVGDPDVLVGGPPCQPFSKSGYWASGDTRRLDDPRSTTLEQYLRVLRDTQPRAFVLENVPGLAYSKKSEGLELLRQEIKAINRAKGTNYRPVVEKLNAAAYGVPQLRHRVFVVGARDGREFTFPTPTHGPEDESLVEGLEPYRTAWDALGDLPQENDDPALTPRGYWADLLPSIPEGENYQWHTSRGGGMRLFGWRTRYWSMLLKLAKVSPSWTIQAQPGPAIGPFHWKNRHLSTQELCRIQTFPDGLVFEGSRRTIQRMLGNAVPSLLAECLAREIRRQVLEDIAGMPSGPLLMPPSRGAPPPPEPLGPVPAGYHHHAGNHEDHPGTGLGPRALGRAG